MERLYWYCRRIYRREPPPDKDAARERARKLRENVQSDDHQMPLEKLLQTLDSSVDKGLSTEFAAQRLAAEGLNALTPPPMLPTWVKFVAELTTGFSLMLWAGALLCFISYSISPEMDNLYLGVVLAAVVTLTGIFSFYQNYRSESLMQSFKSLAPPAVGCIRDGERTNVEASRLVRGDIVILRAGDLVPADLRIIECSDDMVVDNSALTGEPEPQRRTAQCTDANPLETSNMAFSGTSVPNGSCTAVVVSTGDHTVMGRIATLTLETAESQTPIGKEIDHFIKWISVLAIVLGFTFFFVGIAVGREITQNLVFLIGIIVANVPQGLLVTVTVALSLTAVKMYKKAVRVKQLEGVETLGSVSCICSDKTGTLTQNVMTIAQIVYADKKGFSIQDCESSFTRGNKTYDETNPSFVALQRCATLCNTAFFDSATKYFPDGTERPFKMDFVQGDGSLISRVAWKEGKGCSASEVAMITFCQPLRDIEEYRSRNPQVMEATIPFNSKNKYQVHVHCQEEFQPPNSENPQDNKGPRVVLMKGAPERVVHRCTHALLDGKVVPMTDDVLTRLAELQNTLAENGLRVLGFAQKELPVDQYPADYAFTTQPEGFDTPNYPIGEVSDPHEHKHAEEEVRIHPRSSEGMVFIGMMALVDPPRAAVPSAIQKCKTAGIKVIMVTGDHPITAQAIAYKVGILWSKTRNVIEAENKRFERRPGDFGYQDPDEARAIVVPGSKIDAEMGEEAWDFILEHPQVVFARTSPQQKLIIVENCQRLGHNVAVTGDGVNDAPALKKANIGIAMGVTGTEVSKNAADHILLDDNFASIIAAIEEGRLIFDNLKKSIYYTLSSNVAAITPFLCFVTFQTPLPLTTVLILCIDLGTNLVPAISLAYEEAEADIMKRPPRNPKVDALVTLKLVVLAYLQVGVMQATCAFYTWFVVMNDYGYPPHILTGLGAFDMWGKQPLFCRFSGGRYVAPNGDVDLLTDPSVSPPPPGYPLWERGAQGYIIDCEFPLKTMRGGMGIPGGFNFDDASTYNSGKTGANRMITAESISALEQEGYFLYTPWRGRMSSFWDNNWLAWDIEDAEMGAGALGDAEDEIYFKWQPAGLWSICAADPDLSSATSHEAEGVIGALDVGAGKGKGGNFAGCNAGARWRTKQYSDALFCNGGANTSYATLADYDACKQLDSHTLNVRYCPDSCSWECVRDNLFVTSDARVPGQHYAQCLDISSRMTQFEALSHAQTAYFVSMVIVQWADLLICRTRWLSVRSQGMSNMVINFAMFFEAILPSYLCYIPGLNTALGTRPLRFVHWMPPLLWGVLTFIVDELRKYVMRATSPEVVDKATGSVTRHHGWMYRFTYY